MKREFQIYKKGTTTNGKVTVLSNDGKSASGKPFNRKEKISFYQSLGYKVFNMNGSEIK